MYSAHSIHLLCLPGYIRDKSEGVVWRGCGGEGRRGREVRCGGGAEGRYGGEGRWGGEVGRCGVEGRGGEEGRKGGVRGGAVMGLVGWT